MSDLQSLLTSASPSDRYIVYCTVYSVQCTHSRDDHDVQMIEERPADIKEINGHPSHIGNRMKAIRRKYNEGHQSFWKSNEDLQTFGKNIEGHQIFGIQKNGIYLIMGGHIMKSTKHLRNRTKLVRCLGL